MSWGTARFGAWVGLVAVVVWGFWINHLQDVDRCRARNESTERAVLIVVEALVAATQDGVDAQRAEAFRDDIDARLSAAEVDCT